MDERFGGDLVGICHDRPSPRLTALAAAVSKQRSASPRLHVHNMPSPMATCSPSHPFVLFHPTKPHQIKQPLSKIAVNERAVTFFAKKMVRILTIFQIMIIFVTRIGSIPHRQGAPRHRTYRTVSNPAVDYSQYRPVE